MSSSTSPTTPTSRPCATTTGKSRFKTIKGNLFTGTEESTNVPLVTNLRQDPWERYQDQSMMYARWWGDKLWTLIPGVNIVGHFR